MLLHAVLVHTAAVHFRKPSAGSLRQLTTKVAHVLPVSDDGGSTAEIVRVLGGPAVGDIRSRCLRLADDSNDEVHMPLCMPALLLTCLMVPSEAVLLASDPLGIKICLTHYQSQDCPRADMLKLTCSCLTASAVQQAVTAFDMTLCSYTAFTASESLLSLNHSAPQLR